MKAATRVLLCLLPLLETPWEAQAMQVDIYAHKDKFGQSLNMDISERECTNVPSPWRNVTMSVDTHGSCMQFYDGKSCSGKIAVIQPFHTVHQMDLSLINFHNVIQSVSPCGAKVPSGRYVIQSAVDASILTVSKYENQFAMVHTLPPRAFIPKAQQWEILEKVPSEYDIMPRIHETNTPVTYDSEAMKRGSFIRKVWKIESVGRGRYIFKNEWSGKCLYKTRFRQIEEHDCRAWSPNQEWVLRPLLTVARPTPPLPAALNEAAKFQVPSRVVDEYLEQQKFVREQQDLDDSNPITTYKIVNRRKKKPAIASTEFRSRKQNLNEPPQPKVFYSRNQPNFLKPHSRYSLPPPEGMLSIYNNDVKVEDPVFPDFLLRGLQKQDTTAKPGKFNPFRYPKTSKPVDIPLSTGHTNYVSQRPKYDGRRKDPNFKPIEESEEEEDEEEEDEVEVEEHESKSENGVKQGAQRDKEDLEEKNKESEESEEEEEDEGDDGGEEEEDVEQAQQDEKKREDRENAQDSEEDPAVSMAGFMKLLFKGISNKMQDDDKAHEEMIHTFE